MADPQPTAARISPADYEREAAAVLAPGALSYFAGGAGDEITLRDNQAAWNRLALKPKVLVGAGVRDPSVTVLGRRRPHPLIVAPMAFQRLAHPDGEIATATGAAAADALMCLSTLATTAPAALAAAVPDAGRWFQLYVFSDRGVSAALVEEARENGYEALVLTVDLPIIGVRDRELRDGSHASGALVAAAAAAGATGAMTVADFTALIDPALNWRDVERFIANSPLPVIVKGILDPGDAKLAADVGAAGVVVSNHGGRQLDTVLSGADALAAVVETVGDRLEVLVDGGIRRGTDVVKALALGASAVMVGRPVLWGVAVDGPAGVTAVLEMILRELDVALALVGSPRAAELDSTFVTRGPWA
jgi:4-hydroxymandelate oxidase